MASLHDRVPVPAFHGLAGVATRDVPVIEDLHDAESARLATIALFDSPNPPTAIFSAQNLVTIEIGRASCRERV